MEPIKEIKKQTKQIIRERFFHEKIRPQDLNTPQQKEALMQLIEKTVTRLANSYRNKINKIEISNLKKNIADELIGYGAITKYLQDPLVTDIMVNSPNQIFIEKNGKLEKADTSFDDEAEIINIIEQMITESGQRIDRSSPFVDLKIQGDTRVTAVIPPISKKPIISIRKKNLGFISTETLLNFGTLNKNVLEFLKYCVQGRLNIIISGSTGVGKTTLLNFLLNQFVDEKQRVLIIEDTQELVIKEASHYIQLITKAANIEGKGEITLFDLVKLSLHLRPDRIIIGEIRGEEAFNFIQSINTGHNGSMCTLHSNTAQDALMLLEILAMLYKANVNQETIRLFLKLGIHLIIQMIRLPNGQRIISQISDIDYVDGKFVVKDIFTLERKVVDEQEKYEIKFTGHVPSFIDILKARTNIPDLFYRIAE